MSSREFSIRKKKKSAFHYVAYERVESPTCSQWHTVMRSIRWYTSLGFFCSFPFLVFFFPQCIFHVVVFFTQASPDSARHAFLAMICHDFNIKVVSATSKYTAISKKVVAKSARDNPERDCGWF